MQRAASAGVAIPPAAKFGTGSRPFSATQRTSSYGAPVSLASAMSSSSVEDAEGLDARRTARRWRTPSTISPEPASPLVRIMRRAFADPAQGLAEVAAAADEGDLEGVFRDVVFFVGRGEDLALVDEVDLEGLENPGLGDMADPDLGHDRDRDRLLDLLDHLDRGHSRHAALHADVRRDPLQRHDRRRARVFRDLRLLGRR